jgi:hypothetical protein
MPIQGRFMSLATLGLLCVLSAGGGVWSALTGPRVADVQLQDAASNTVAAPSFVATVNATIKEAANVPSGATSVVRTETSTADQSVVYQAPDRVMVKESTEVSPASGISSSQTDLVQIGTSCWQSASQSSASTGCQASAFSKFLDLVSGLETSSGATLRDGTFELTATDSRRFIVTDVLGDEIGSSPLEDPIVQVRIQGSDVVWEHLSFHTTESAPDSSGPLPESISVSFNLVAQFTEIGSAPPVVRPAGPPTSTG